MQHSDAYEQIEIMDLLLIEDDDAKRDRLAAFVDSAFPNIFSIRFARSVNAAIDRLLEKIPDVILLDMSLPTFDVGPNERGGRPQGFGGMEVLGSMERYEIAAPVVVVTQYEAFTREGAEVDHEALSGQLTEEFPDRFVELIYFNTVFGDWEGKLATVLNGLKRDFEK